jgi:hypothetical protein
MSTIIHGYAKSCVSHCMSPNVLSAFSERPQDFAAMTGKTYPADGGIMLSIKKLRALRDRIAEARARHNHAHLVDCLERAATLSREESLRTYCDLHFLVRYDALHAREQQEMMRFALGILYLTLFRLTDVNSLTRLTCPPSSSVVNARSDAKTPKVHVLMARDLHDLARFVDRYRPSAALLKSVLNVGSKPNKSVDSWHLPYDDDDGQQWSSWTDAADGKARMRWTQIPDSGIEVHVVDLDAAMRVDLDGPSAEGITAAHEPFIAMTVLDFLDRQNLTVNYARDALLCCYVMSDTRLFVTLAPVQAATYIQTASMVLRVLGGDDDDSDDDNDDHNKSPSLEKK